MVSTHLKNISQNGNFHQIGVKIENVWNHHLEDLNQGKPKAHRPLRSIPSFLEGYVWEGETPLLNTSWVLGDVTTSLQIPFWNTWHATFLPFNEMFFFSTTKTWGISDRPNPQPVFRKCCLFHLTHLHVFFFRSSKKRSGFLRFACGFFDD